MGKLSQNLSGRRYLLISFFFSFGCLYLILYFYQNHLELEETSTTIKPQIIHWTKLKTSLDCYYSVQDDALPSLENENFSTGDKAIFFHETSCRGGINSRQACAIESAARLHPKWQINLLFNSPVTEYIIKNSNLVKLLKYGNVKLGRLKINQYGKGTIVEDILTNQLKQSAHPIEHAADILRIVTLHKFGGVYLDTDSILVRNLEALPPNWIAKEEDSQVSSGAMAITKDGFGRNLTTAILTELRDTFNPKSWSYNGPAAIKRVLNRMCPNYTNCKDLEVFSPKDFYPIYYTKHKFYFENGTLMNMEHPYMHHMWNYLTKDLKIEKYSPYATLARQFCPTIYKMYGDQFGE
ncbi:unnamed protein product [Arctia plantaginis]|uniref:Alpha 1,4-glycosyltransferase domain-containing protein n=1 Tax=Arctia plantaginis TaxID=874455 RepID=A0A8S1B5G2_ARCPL|nr:unnamed protein product [Arctia plantaginis]